MPAKTILIVDDSALIRQVLTDALEQEGYRVDVAADGVEALERIGSRRPDLVLADVLMPVMDGWALCEAIRRTGATRDLPFIFLTTERDVPKRIRGLEMGADDYICKPFSKEEVVTRVGSVLRRARRGGKPARKQSTGSLESLHLGGHTDHITVPDLLQMLSMNGKSGTLHLRGRSVARIFFRAGQIINAEVQGLRGKKALFRIMAWPEAHFRFEPGEPSRSADAALQASTSSVLMEGFTQIDELRELMARLPEPTTRVRRTRGCDEEPPDLSTSHRILLRAATRGATLADLADAVPDHDLAAYAALGSLLQRGLLEICEEAGPAERARADRSA